MANPAEARQEYNASVAMVSRSARKPTTPLTFNGMETNDLFEDTNNRCSWTRLILTGRGVLVMVVENWGGDCAVLALDARIFLESLKVTAA